MAKVNMEQIKMMDSDRKKLVTLLFTLPDGFEKDELLATIRAHDVEVGKLLGIKWQR
jgi:hypothetical protein